MLEVKINKGNVTKMKATGSMIEIIGDIIIMLHDLYNIIDESSNDAAIEFQHVIEQAIKYKIIFGDDDCMSKRIADSIKKMNEDVGGDNS